MSLAGHETTAATLGFLMYYLTQHPEWEQRIRQEARVRWLSNEQWWPGCGCTASQTGNVHMYRLRLHLDLAVLMVGTCWCKSVSFVS